MKITYEAYSVGYSKDKQAGYGACLEAVSDDGRTREFASTSHLGDFNKNQADLISVMMAMRCINEEHVDQEVVIHTPPGYATMLTDRNSDGAWKTTPGSNVELVEELRGWAGRFSNLTFKPGTKSTEQFKKCFKMAEAIHASSGD